MPDTIIINYSKFLFFILIIFSGDLFAKEVVTVDDLKIQISNLRIVNDDVYITLTLKNKTAKDTYVDKKNFPCNGFLWSNLFNIKKIEPREQSLEYLGKLVNRGKPLRESDYMVFKAMESKSMEINLSKFYRLGNSSGKYSITYDSENIRYETPIIFQQLVSNSLALERP